MFGWRKRIGWIATGVLEIVPYGFYRFAPEGIGLSAVTCDAADAATADGAERASRILRCAHTLGAEGVDHVIVDASDGGLAFGGDDAVSVERIEAAAGVRVTPIARAVADALGKLGARRLAVASPFPAGESTVEPLVASLRELGIDATHVEALGLPGPLRDVPPVEICGLARSVMRRAGAADALYLPSTSWQASLCAAVIERDVGVPVVTDIHAACHAAFTALGIADPIEGHGRLLASLSKR